MGLRLRSDSRLKQLETLYREHHRRVRWVLRGRGITDDALDDLVHEVFLAVFRRLPERDPQVALPTWISGVARNVAFSHRRGVARRSAAARAQPPPPAVEGPDEVVARRRAWLELDAFLGGLDADQREVFVMAELLGMKVPEVAEVVDAPLNTLYSRLRIARRHFNERFGPRNAEQLRRAGQGECPTRAQRNIVWMLIATKVAVPIATTTAASTATATALTSKWLLVGGVAAAAIATSAAVLTRDASPRDEARVEARGANEATPVTDAPDEAAASLPAAPASVAPASPRAEPKPDVRAALPAERQEPANRARRPSSAEPREARAGSGVASADSLAETVDALREAQTLMGQGRAADALAGLDRVDASASGPLRTELRRIERQAACATGDQERASRAHRSLVASGLASASESTCTRKVEAP